VAARGQGRISVGCEVEDMVRRRKVRRMATPLGHFSFRIAD
jgi:hypothetical protein